MFIIRLAGLRLRQTSHWIAVFEFPRKNALASTGRECMTSRKNLATTPAEPLNGITQALPKVSLGWNDGAVIMSSRQP